MTSVEEENPTHDRDLPAAPNDHNSCSICYLIGQAVSNLALTLALEVTASLFEQSLADSELAAPAVCCTPIAQDPPACRTACC